MTFKFLLVCGILFQTISALSLLDLLNLTGNGNSDWENGVQKCYDGCIDVFRRYPNNIYGIGDNLIESFKSYIDVSKMWNISNSTIMSTQSTDLLETISLLSDLGISPSYSLYVHRKANPKLFMAYRKIVLNLPKYINQLTSNINEVLTELEGSFDDMFDQFNRLCLLGLIVDCRKLCFNRIMNSGQHLANTISFIVNIALNHTSSETIANDTYEAIAILVCILFDNFLNIQGAIISKAAVLTSQGRGVSDFHYSCLLSMDPFIRGIAGTMNSLTVDIAKGVRDLCGSLLAHVGDYNNALSTLIGPINAVAISAEHVLDNLLKTRQNRCIFKDV